MCLKLATICLNYFILLSHAVRTGIHNIWRMALIIVGLVCFSIVNVIFEKEKCYE